MTRLERLAQEWWGPHGGDDIATEWAYLEGLKKGIELAAEFVDRVDDWFDGDDIRALLTEEEE